MVGTSREQRAGTKSGRCAVMLGASVIVWLTVLLVQTSIHGNRRRLPCARRDGLLTETDTGRIVTGKMVTYQAVTALA